MNSKEVAKPLSPIQEELLKAEKELLACEERIYQGCEQLAKLFGLDMRDLKGDLKPPLEAEEKIE